MQQPCVALDRFQPGRDLLDSLLFSEIISEKMNYPRGLQMASSEAQSQGSLRGLRGTEGVPALAECVGMHISPARQVLDTEALRATGSAGPGARVALGNMKTNRT